MAKQDLHVSVPSYFRCPISLEVMKSPVALCTGITYDRSSIQTWLDAGNLTCPATMQPLPSADFVPNLSLHRLIHLWSLSIPSPRSPSPRHRLCLLMNRISTSSTTTNVKELSVHLASVLHLARDCKDNREALVNSERFVASLVELMYKSSEIEFLELAVMVLDLISRDSDKFIEQIQKLLSKRDLTPVSSVLQAGKAESRVAAAKFLEAIAIDTEVKRKLSENQILIDHLYSLVISDGDNLIEGGLSTLISLATMRPLKSELVRLGIVRTIGNILSNNNRTGAVIIKAMEMVEVLATCSTGRSAISDDEKIVADIVKRLMMKGSEKATGHGITVLWSVCYLFKSKKAVNAANGSNGQAKCLLVMQSKCSAVVRQMCRDLVKVLRVDSVAPGLTSFEHKTMHIMPC